MKNFTYFFSFLLIFFLPRFAFAIPDSFADLVERLSPAVVSIASTTIVKDNNNQNQIPEEDSTLLVRILQPVIDIPQEPFLLSAQ